MPSSVCHGCRNVLSEETNVKNIFSDDTLIKSLDSNGAYDEKWSMKLLHGIELITGKKITKEQSLPDKLCNACFKNVEAFINFRHQLLRSRDIFLNKLCENTDKDISATTHGKTHSPAVTSSDSKIETNDGFHNLPLIADNNSSNQLQKISSEDLINVDENSNTSIDSNALNKNENNFLSQKLQIDQEDSKADSSDDSTDNIIVTNIDNKQNEHDIESEIDVCSGEEDDVLELDVQKTKNETVEINSSSESDIEVCDYEPVNKRANYGSTLSPPLRY